MKRSRQRIIGRLVLLWILFNVGYIAVFAFIHFHKTSRQMDAEKLKISKLIGENKEIEGRDFGRDPAVTCDNGVFVGKKKKEVCAYKGIPYARPPVGDLRWKPPSDAPPSDKVFEAYYFGKSGIQTEAESERASFYLQGEDCLTLNVWTAADGASAGTGDAADSVSGIAADAASGDALRPVMVFFPGGAFGWGGTADPIYDGQNFVEAHSDVVLVTVNYRIGMMGFIDFSEVEGGEDYAGSGNLGLLDQICALRWVSRNIQKFGGDPGNVTIFGESAGAASASLLPLIDDAKGLFQRAIVQSGSIALTFSKEECRELTRQLLKEAKAESMKDLLALSEPDLMRINEKLNDQINFPERDGIVLPEDLYGAYAAGAASEIEMLSGTNADEIRYWINEVGGYEVFRLAARLLYGSVLDRFAPRDQSRADAFLDLQSGDRVWRIADFFSDLLFRVPADRQAVLHTQNGGRHYLYYWTKQSEIEHFGACHAVELSYVFNNVDDTIYTGAKADEHLAETVQDMWVNFAKTGDPSADGYVWEPFEEKERKTMILGDEVQMNTDLFPQRRVLIEPLLRYNINGQYKVVDYALIFLWKRILQAAGILVAVNLIIAGIIHLRRKK